MTVVTIFIMILGGGFSFTIWKNRRGAEGAEWSFGWHCWDQGLHCTALKTNQSLHCITERSEHCVKHQIKFTLQAKFTLYRPKSLHCIGLKRCNTAVPAAVALIKDYSAVCIKFQSASSVSLLALLWSRLQSSKGTFVTIPSSPRNHPGHEWCPIIICHNHLP